MFPNGNWLSTIWGPMTYSDNYDVEYNDLEKLMSEPLWSDTVEILFSCGDELRHKILEKYNEGGDDPIGYLTQDKWLEIVNLLSQEKETTPGEQN